MGRQHGDYLRGRNPVQTLHTFGRTVEEALSEADLELQAHDLVSPAPGSHLMTGMTINIARAFPVTVTADSSVTEIWTTPVTVAELLEREGFQLGPWDRTEPAEDTFLTARAEINLIRVEKVYSTRKSVIPYGEIQREMRTGPGHVQGHQRQRPTDCWRSW